MDEEKKPLSIPSYRLGTIVKEEPTTLAPFEEKNWMKWILLGLLLVSIPAGIYYYIVSSAQVNKSTTSALDTTPSAQIQKETNPAMLIGVNENYLKLDTILYQLTKTNNTSNYSKRYQLYIRDNKVRVEIELKDISFQLPAEFGTEEKRQEEFLQALVQIDKLVELAQDTRILAIRTEEK